MIRQICRPHVAVMFLILASAPAFARDVSATTKPVPDSMVDGAVLTDEEHNFTMTAPSAEWKWLMLESPDMEDSLANYVCQSPYGDESYIVIVGRMRGRKMDIDSYIKGVTESAGKYGAAVVSSGSSPVDIPREGTFRVTWKSHLANGMQIHTTAYVLLEGLVYSIMFNTREEGEPERFTAFVRSFKTLGPAKWTPVLSKEELEQHFMMVGMGLLGLTLIVAFVGFVVNRIADRPVLNAGALAALILVAALVLNLVRVYRMSWDGIISETDVSYFSGMIVGGILLPGLAAAGLSRRFRRWKKAYGEAVAARVDRGEPPA